MRTFEILGVVLAPIERKQTKKGSTLIEFKIRPYKQDTDYQDPHPIPIVMFAKRAENFINTVKPYSEVALHGKVDARDWTNPTSGKVSTFISLVAEDFELKVFQEPTHEELLNEPVRMAEPEFTESDIPF